MEIVAMVNDRREILRYLKHIGMSEHPPPIEPARYEQRELQYDETAPQHDVQMHPDYD